MGVIGDMTAFQAYQLGQAMPIAAANPAGGIAGAGVGLGMGVAMAGPLTGRLMGGAPGGPGPGPQMPSTPPPPPAAWHVAQNGQSAGPFSAEQMAAAAAAGNLRRDTLVWTAGLADWTTAEAF